MADVTITAANVGVAESTARVRVVQYGAAVTQGQPVYLSGGKYYPAEAGDTSAKASAAAIALTPGGTDDWGVICTSGKVDIGGTVVVGTTYVVSATVGGIAPESDLVSTDYVTHLGVATTTSVIDVSINATGVQKP